MGKGQDSFFLKQNKSKNTVQKNKVGQGKRQEEFDQNRATEAEKPEKKPFDKKTYRLKKYSKKYKLEQWEEQRKKRLLREYHKEIKNDTSAGTYNAKKFDEDVPDGNEEVGKYVRHPDLLEKSQSGPNSTAAPVKKDPFFKEKEQFNKIKQEKIVKQQEAERIKEEKKQKLEEYKKKKHDKFKKLSKKTKKGQPVMTGRLELLLEKIQGSK